jgi:hypothetical protein
MERHRTWLGAYASDESLRRARRDASLSGQDGEGAGIRTLNLGLKRPTRSVRQRRRQSLPIWSRRRRIRPCPPRSGLVRSGFKSVFKSADQERIRVGRRPYSGPTATLLLFIMHRSGFCSAVEPADPVGVGTTRWGQVAGVLAPHAAAEIRNRITVFPAR